MAQAAVTTLTVKIMKITGRTSWFGGPNDSMNTGTAIGLPDTARGIAVYNQSTLGGYWRVHWPNGRVSVERQIDIGPSPTGGRKIDFTSAAIQANGYTENSYPTDSMATIEYLGKKKPSGATTSGGTKKPSGATTSGGTAPMQQLLGGIKLARLLSLQGSNASPYDANAGAGQVAAINPLKSILGRALSAEQAGKATSRASVSTPAAPAPAAPAVIGGPGFGYNSGTPSLSHPTIQSALRRVASQYGHKLMVGTTTNHSKFTTSGNISDHYSGNAADIPASGQALTKMGQAALVALGKPRSWALQQKGGLYTFNYNGKRYQVIFNTTQGGNHWNHLHVGVA